MISLWYKLICIVRWFDITFTKRCFISTFIAWVYNSIILIPLNVFHFDDDSLRISLFTYFIDNTYYEVYIRIGFAVFNITLIHFFLKHLQAKHMKEVILEHKEKAGQRPIKWRTKFSKQDNVSWRKACLSICRCGRSKSTLN
jgi:hypothetical protein